MSTFRYKHGTETVETSYRYEDASRVLEVQGTAYPCSDSAVTIEGRRVPFWTHREGERAWVWLDGEVFSFAIDDPRHRGSTEAAEGIAGGTVKAQMPGKVIQVAVQPGQAVQVGQNLLIMESMKMELALDAPVAGTVREVKAAIGQMVSQGEILIELDEAQSDA